MEELFAAVLGAVVGAGATLYVEARRQSSAEKKAEWNALDLLLLDLGRRRVFLVPSRTLVRGTDTSSGSEFDRMTRSVLAIRAQIAEVMRSLRPKSPARGPVRAMYRACNSFLESAERSPERHWIAADDLRLALGAQAEVIAGSSKGNVEFMLPGSEAL